MITIQNTFFGNPNFGIVSITINPENDTAAILKEHAAKLGVKSTNWHFLTGDKTKIFEEEGVHTIWHFALENTDEFGKYGVYANGLLVETIDISGIFIKEYNMTLIE